MAATISDVVDVIGFGPFQILAACVGGGIWAADGSEILMLGSITRAVSDDWCLDSFQKGLLVSLVFVGVGFGNFLSGSVGDAFGRRPAVVVSYACIVVFSVLSSFSWNVWSMAFCRICVGAGFGLGQPAWSAMCSETSPTHLRAAMNVVSNTSWCLGEIYSALLLLADDPHLKELDWRRLVILASLPSLILGTLAWCFLPESPHVLAHQGNHAEACKVLVRMAALNGRSKEAEDAMRSCRELADCNDSDESDTEEDEDSEGVDDLSFCDTMSILWGRRFGFTTAVVCFSSFVANFLYYGGVYSFPQILPTLDMKISPAANLFLGSAFEVVGMFIAMWSMSTFKRKKNFQIGLVTQLLSIFIFLRGICVKTSHSVTEMQVGFLGMKLTISIVFSACCIYATEVYPTAVRASGTAAVYTVGRLGAMLCPFMYEFMTHYFGGNEKSSSSWAFFVFLAAITVPNAALVLCLPFETFGKKLTDAEE